MDTKTLIIIFLSSLILLFIFHKFVNSYIKSYKPWTVNSILNKLDVEEKPTKSRIKGKYEKKCRDIFESLFDTDFPKIRPDFIVNTKTGKRLELDGYNEKLKLAFEYQGQQHYNFSPYFHKTQEDFTNQVYRDKIKKEACDKKGITLIEIPYNIEYNDLEDYIKMKLFDEGFFV